MIDSVDDNPTRRALRGAIKLLLLIGLLAVAYAFTRSLLGPGTGDGTAEYRVDLAGLPEGAVQRIDWAGRRYLVLHRSPDMLATLEAKTGPALADPGSRRSRQPAGVEGTLRSLSARYLVVLDYDTALNCPLDLVPPTTPDAEGWVGGLRDPCAGSRYDFAGRVLAGERAPRNLGVPAHRLSGDALILLAD
ncbi:MAG: ubiquinol-cytochrome C reductase, iron-sulfur subunit [Gammaproteobacteria bacterium]|nr:ubiquinol-cytochrome C reductase, iron-sulfur subunit [Gammaproteobacteria bacterium]MDX5375794.1 ubiquinol-cytochrome C reductase, iron-sulfur subunit [Gammaproteobacteria bacterium]